jgi:NADH-quinone oxidoreductase subunit C
VSDSQAGHPEQEGAKSPDQAQAGQQETLATPGQDGHVHGLPAVDYFGSTVVHTDRERYQQLMGALKQDGFEMLVGVTGVDYLMHPGRDLPAGIAAERFEVVVELLSLSQHRRVRVRCQVPASDPHLPTLFDLWPGSEAHERETFDMLGIVFDDHPDMTRILMPEDWEGHPLRKDYATGHVPVQFKESPGGR